MKIYPCCNYDHVTTQRIKSKHWYECRHTKAPLDPRGKEGASALVLSRDKQGRKKQRVPTRVALVKLFSLALCWSKALCWGNFTNLCGDLGNNGSKGKYHHAFSLFSFYPHLSWFPTLKKVIKCQIKEKNRKWI